MRPYGVRDVERLLRLPRSTIRALIAAGFVAPERGPRGAWRFSFQDLIVLRTAQALFDANVPQRRITRSMRELRRQLPAAMPLSGLSIGAVADRVVVREGGSRWQAESGQYVLDFDSDPADGSLSVIERTGDFADASRDAPGGETAGDASASDDAASDAQHWFAMGVALEPDDTDAALQAYTRAIADDPTFVDARVNLGRLLHANGRHVDAERVYRHALARCGDDPVLLFNLGVLFEDMKRTSDAKAAYETALRRDPDLADAHYNLSLLYERLGRPKDALRHMARYRVLVASRLT